MQKAIFFIGIVILSVTGSAQQPATSLTHRELCKRFSDAVIRIEAGGQSRGTGFLVSADGFILTAAHVVRGDDGAYFSAITAKLPDGTTEFATPSPMTIESAGQDFAVLKVKGKTKLPFLGLGSFEDAELGSDATIIGYPFSAITAQGKNVSIKFCLTAAVAASDLATVPVSVSRGNLPFNQDVKVNVIYFQGPSVKGISGSPVISRDTGKVIGIVSVKLSGIGSELNALKDATGKGLGSGISISGLQSGPVIHKILTVLDDQLANDLGAATGIDDPKHALAQAQRQNKNPPK